MKAEIGQMSGEIATERWENEGGPQKSELMSAVMALYHTHDEVSKTQAAFAATKHQGMQDHACVASDLATVIGT